MSDNGAAMKAEETRSGLARLGILHELTLEHSPEQNGKQEKFWEALEQRLVAMVEGVPDRILTIDPEVALVDLLAGEAPGIDDGELSPLWSCVPVRHLLQLVFHAVIEATSRRGKWDVKEPSTPRPDGPRRDRRTEERVYYLPGSLDIHVRRAIQEAKRGAVSRGQIRRCLVRGYRRRANPGWKDFITSHWRGPEDGPIVERPYRLLP